MVIAIDYDGTITENEDFPNKAPIREDAKIYIKKLYDLGYTLVLWTARYGDYYTECINDLKKSNLYKYFDFTYNKHGETGKLIANFYIDDRSLLNEINWADIYNYIININN